MSEEPRDFVPIKLSDLIRGEWEKSNSGEPTRRDLQTLGDKLRQERGASVLGELACERIDRASQAGRNRFVIDGIRNLGEIRHFRDRFGYRFTLFGIVASMKDRWLRIGSIYRARGLSEFDFVLDDRRDRNEETKNGQQVELCVDQAEILLSNSLGHEEFRKSVLEYADLATGDKPRPARADEIFMNMAYSAALSSKCLKRNVGAVIVDENQQVIGIGYNENPLPTAPCVLEKTYNFQCYRDIIRNRHFKSLAQKGARCPNCGSPLVEIQGPPWLCENCKIKGEKTNLEEFFFPDRALNWCTAVHAEVWALSVAAGRGRRGTLYVTTFPCLQCAEQIIQAGVRKVVYTEAYPDVRGEERLLLAGIPLEQFQGVRSFSFQRILSPLHQHSI